MGNRPSLKEYAMARLVTIAVTIFLIFSFFLLLIIKDQKSAWISIAFLAASFSVFIFIIYRITGRMQNELSIVAKYLDNIDKTEIIDYKTDFFTQEFADLNNNLIKVLKSFKKREAIKQRYNAKLKLKNKQRKDMISAISHEFRNPIASIMGYSQTLQDDPDIPMNLQRKFLDKIYNNGNKIEALLSRLILWNKFESGEANLYKSTFDISALIFEIKQSIEEKYKNRNINIDAPSYKIEADRTLIEVVLKNIIENALKYSQDDIQIKVADGLVSVTDFGVGIRDKDLNSVTKKFYRSGTHNWDNSMGLGLSIVKNILTLHNTSLNIESKVDEGSTFSFKI
ncbi:Sensor histidine kinase [hydrothermal vent metagenome]|uniref:histidine kinase n=1 Tax=hydrothermal vent metagenome TaxID=652676 RepID=A0A1W1EC92_9ZZZZ